MFLFFLAAPVRADWKDGELVEEGPGAQILMDFAENMPWIADGEDTGKYLYVIADAGCSATRQLYSLTRGYAKEMQIRWIFVDLEGGGTYNSLYEERTPQALQEAFSAQTLPADKDPKRARKIDLYATKGVVTMLVLRRMLAPTPEEFGFPTLLYGDANKVTVSVGFDPSDLKTIITSIPTVAVKSGFTPLALLADQGTVKLKPVPAGYKYMNTNSDNTPMYMMPDQKAPRVGSVASNADWPLECKGVTEDGFIAMEVTKNGGYIYCYDPAEVERIVKRK